MSYDPYNPQNSSSGGDILPGYGAPPAEGGFAQAPASAPTPLYSPPAAPPATKPKRRAQPLHVALLAISLVLVLSFVLLAASLFSLGSGFSDLFAQQYYSAGAPSGTFSVVQVVGSIQSTGNNMLGIGEHSYQHADTVAYINQLAQADGNAGILLYMNTGGGGMYESDEVYLALQAYKEQTGRPVWAYMANTCASGGYYICAAAEHIVANRNTTTGSIGVYIAMTDTSELYEKLGIETVLVSSGSNKGVGMEGVPITEAQRAVYQSIVDEYYDLFCDIVAEGRALPMADVRELADGRVYTASQAQSLGLIDEIGDWNTVLEDFSQHTGATAYYPSFSHSTLLGQMIGSVFGSVPKGDVETALSMAEKYPVGVPMALYDPAA